MAESTAESLPLKSLTVNACYSPLFKDAGLEGKQILMEERSSAQHLFQYITKLHVPGVTFLAAFEEFQMFRCQVIIFFPAYK